MRSSWFLTLFSYKVYIFKSTFHYPVQLFNNGVTLLFPEDFIIAPSALLINVAYSNFSRFRFYWYFLRFEFLVVGEIRTRISIGSRPRQFNQLSYNHHIKRVNHYPLMFRLVFQYIQGIYLHKLRGRNFNYNLKSGSSNM